MISKLSYNMQSSFCHIGIVPTRHYLHKCPAGRTNIATTDFNGAPRTSECTTTPKRILGIQLIGTFLNHSLHLRKLIASISVFTFLINNYNACRVKTRPVWLKQFLFHCCVVTIPTTQESDRVLVLYQLFCRYHSTKTILVKDIEIEGDWRNGLWQRFTTYRLRTLEVWHLPGSPQSLKEYLIVDQRVLNKNSIKN